MKGDQQRDKIVQLLDKIVSNDITPSASVSISDGNDTTLGAKADSQATDSTSSWSAIALLKGIRTALVTLSSTLTTAAKGATVSGNPTSRSKSVDVTALDVQIVDAVGNPIVTFGGAVTNDGTFATPVLQGALTETAPATDTASSGANGRLQRIAQNITTLISSILQVSGRDIDNAAQSASIKPLPIGGQAVNTSTYSPAYTAGDAAQAAYDKDNGSLLVTQGVLDKSTDSISAYAPQTASANTPSLASSTTAAAANSARKSINIQNQATNLLYIRLGTGASSTVYHVVLKACSVAGDGTGGSFYTDEFTGLVSIAGTSISYTVTEL